MIYYSTFPTTEIGYAVVSVILGLIWTLPWCLKQAELWNLLKRWYNYLLAGGLLAFPSILIYSSISQLGSWTVYIYLAIKTIALLLGTIGILGMCKKLLLK